MGIIKISEARKLMGKTNKKYSDEQIEEVINIFTVLSDMAIDSYLEKRRQKRAEGLESKSAILNKEGSNRNEL